MKKKYLTAIHLKGIIRIDPLGAMNFHQLFSHNVLLCPVIVLVQTL